MTLTLVKIINIEILYDLDWNLTFVEDSGDLNFWIEEDSPGPRVSGDSDDQDIQRSQIQVDSDQAIQILIVPWFHHNRTQNIFSWDGKSNSLILFPGDRRNIQRLIFLWIFFSEITNAESWLAEAHLSIISSWADLPLEEYWVKLVDTDRRARKRKVQY